MGFLAEADGLVSDSLERTFWSSSIDAGWL